MAGEIIRPTDLPDRASPVASEKVPVDNGSTVAGATIEALVNAGRPLANQSEAEAGVQATKAMTPLSTKQAIFAQGDVRFASAAQGALANSATQPGDLSTVATTGAYADLSGKPTLGTAAAQNSTAFATAAQGAKADTAVQSVVAGANITVDAADPLNPIITASNGGGSSGLCRLTLTSGTPFMATDVAASDTIYLTPCGGNTIPLWNGTALVSTLFAEVSNLTTNTAKNPAAAIADRCYDLFVWNDTGTLRLSRGPAWTTDPGTGAGSSQISFVGGVPVNTVAITNGPAAGYGTYVGTIRTNGSALVDYIFGGYATGGKAAVFGVWNFWNRAPVMTAVVDSTDSWTYTTATTFRAADNSTTMRVSRVCRFDNDNLSFEYHTLFAPGSGSSARVGVGLNSVTAFVGSTGLANVAGVITQAIGKYVGKLGVGWNWVNAVEWVATSAGGTFYGDAGSPTQVQSSVLYAELWQ